MFRSGPADTNWNEIGASEARIRTRALASSTDTYAYAGTSKSVVRLADTVSGTIDSIVDTGGNRLGATSGTAHTWFVPDLHGNVATQLTADTLGVTYATRYDPWGETVDVGPDSGAGPVAPTTWTYQGRLDVSPSGLATPLLDGGARMYSPGLGAFTSLDSVMGSAQNPLSMNRYLYAEANPATLIDPTGHCTSKMIDNQICEAAGAAPFVRPTKSGCTDRRRRARWRRDRAPARHEFLATVHGTFGSRPMVSSVSTVKEYSRSPAAPGRCRDGSRSATTRTTAMSPRPKVSPIAGVASPSSRTTVTA